MARRSLSFASAFALGVVWAGGLAARGDEKLKEEYVRFAEQAGMDVAVDYHSGYPRRPVAENLKALAGARFTDPALRNAAKEFEAVARLYTLANRAYHDHGVWTTPETKKVLSEARARVEADDFFGAGKVIVEAERDKAKSRTAAGLLVVRSSGVHSLLWKSVLPIAKKLGGPDRNTLPVRFESGIFLRNIYGKTLNNVTVLIETTACAELPEGQRACVLFFKSLDPDYTGRVPHWLTSKQRNAKTGKRTPAANLWRVSIWSDEVACEDVPFGLGYLKNRSRWVYADGLCMFPDATYKGKNAYTPDTRIAPTAPDQFVAGTRWRGELEVAAPFGKSEVGILVVVTEREGDTFKATMQRGRAGKSAPLKTEIVGTIVKGAIQWTTASPKDTPKDGRGQLAEGEILGRVIEAGYTDPAARGAPIIRKISLRRDLTAR